MRQKQRMAMNRTELVKVLKDVYEINTTTQSIKNWEKDRKFPKEKAEGRLATYDIKKALIFICGEKLGVELFNK